MIKVAVICDYLEERWPSMDLVGDMLLDQLRADSEIQATCIRPVMRRWLTSGNSQAAHNADRFLNRFLEYPRFLRRNRDFDVFHIVDHSYAHLVHSLPAHRTVVTCHDIDAFRSVLTPAEEPRGAAFRAMTAHILRGLKKAAVVTCDSLATRQALLDHEVRPAASTPLAPLGVHPSCSPDANLEADREVASLMGAVNPFDILHVGSTIPRKRIDVLLEIFNGVRKRFPAARLIRVGGGFTEDQQKLVESLDLGASVVVLPHLTRDTLAAVYRRVALVLQPSDREGFGLPVAEAMACGTPVIASDLDVLREIGGSVATYCETGNASAWIPEVIRLLEERAHCPHQWRERTKACLRQAAGFTWTAYAARMSSIYRTLYPQKIRTAGSGEVRQFTRYDASVYDV